jgi:hypothetical protein
VAADAVESLEQSSQSFVQRWGENLLTLFSRYPGIILAVPSAYLLVTFPPLWKDVDAICQLILKAGSVNILHFPPVYCFLGRIPFVAAAILTGQPVHGIFAEQTPSLLGIYLLVIGQHVALVASLTYAVVAICGTNRISRVACAILFASMSGLYAEAHCCGSESIGVAATLAVFAAGIAMIRQPGISSWIVYGVALFVAIGSRHLNLLLAAWLPATFMLLKLTERFRMSERIASLYSIGIAIGIGLVAIEANSLLARVLIASVGDQYRSTLGETLSDRIDSFLRRLPADERLKVSETLSSNEKDPLVRQAIQYQATVGRFYSGTEAALTRAIANTGMPGSRVPAETDRAILAATLSYLRSCHPVLIKVIQDDFFRGLFANNRIIALAPFDSHVSGANDRVKRPDAWANLAGYRYINLQDANENLKHARKDHYIGLWAHLPIAGWITFEVCVSLIAVYFVRQVFPLVVVMWTVIATGLTMFLANMVCVYYMDRYALILLISSAIAAAVALAALAEIGIEREKRGWKFNSCL